MITEGKPGLASFQRADGAFPSYVHLRKGELTLDFNCFVTACIVRALRHMPAQGPDTLLIERSLDWLQRQQSASPPHAYAFWPQRDKPIWARNVPDDLDDTAIIASELLRHHRIDRAAARRLFRDVMAPNRVEHSILPHMPPWIAEGSFFTWVAPPGRMQGRRGANIVDCCVNANIAAFIALVDGPGHPGIAEAVATINAGLDWASGDANRLSALTPFYPSVLNFLEAVEHAAECGVGELQVARMELRRLSARLDTRKSGICRAAYSSSVIWHSPALEIAQRLSRDMIHPQELAYVTH